MDACAFKLGYLQFTVEHAMNECSVLVYLEGSAHQLQLLGDVAGLVHLQHSASGSYPELRLEEGMDGRGGEAGLAGQTHNVQPCRHHGETTHL